MAWLPGLTPSERCAFCSLGPASSTCHSSVPAPAARRPGLRHPRGAASSRGATLVAQGASASLPATDGPSSSGLRGAEEAYRPPGSSQNGNGAASSSGQQPAGAAAAYESYPEWEAGRQQAGRKVAVLQAQKAASLLTAEGARPLRDYMRLPASQYSVLDAQRIERIDDSTFRCYVGALKFLGLTVEPVLTVSVRVSPRGPVVKLLDTRLQGSPAVEAANKRFWATMTNVVAWDDHPAVPLPEEGPHQVELHSDTTILVALEVPGWFKLLPLGAIESTGSGVMQRVLDRMVPRFLRQLSEDYALWAAGDDSRKAIGTGQL